jgi:hypothetical protein
MEKTFDDVDLFVASLLAMVFSFIIFAKSISWCNEGGISDMACTFDNGVLLGAFVAIATVLGIIYMWERGKAHENDKDWWEHPLGLPTGSVRALIALLFIALIAITGGKEEWLVGIVGTIIGFYFGGKKTSEGNEGLEQDEEEEEGEDVSAIKIDEILNIPNLPSELKTEIERIRNAK